MLKCYKTKLATNKLSHSKTSPGPLYSYLHWLPQTLKPIYRTPSALVELIFGLGNYKSGSVFKSLG